MNLINCWSSFELLKTVQEYDELCFELFIHYYYIIVLYYMFYNKQLWIYPFDSINVQMYMWTAAADGILGHKSRGVQRGIEKEEERGTGEWRNIFISEGKQFNQLIWCTGIWWTAAYIQCSIVNQCLIFTFPVFSATMNIRKILTSNVPVTFEPAVLNTALLCIKIRIFHSQNGTILIKYKYKDWILLVCFSWRYERQRIHV